MFVWEKNKKSKNFKSKNDKLQIEENKNKETYDH